MMEQGGEKQDAIEPRRNRLWVVLHGYGGTAQRMDAILRLIDERDPNAEIYCPQLPIREFSMIDPFEVVEVVCRRIQERSETHPEADIVLVGHSAGAVLARAVYARANGMNRRARLDETLRFAFADRIRRVTMLAAVNRGWTFSSALGVGSKILWGLGTILGDAVSFLSAGKLVPFIYAFRRGAPFLTTVRLQCLALDDVAETEFVQVLGTKDDMVGPDDDIDVAVGSNYTYLEAPDAGHYSIVKLDQLLPDARRAVARALFDPVATLSPSALEKKTVWDLALLGGDDFGDETVKERNRRVDRVVFIIHGIRDNGFWTRRIAHEVLVRGEQAGRHVRTVTSTYGFFPMGPFLLPWVRRQKAEWLLDQYVMARSLYPRAHFSYIGHSNGTQILAQSLEMCEATSWDRVVTAGSVVRRRYDWAGLLKDGRVGAVLNFVATADWVVAIFPGGLEKLRLSDLGGAGPDGFASPGNPALGADGQVLNVVFARGGHPAALDVSYWSAMADYTLGSPNLPLLVNGSKQSEFIRVLGLLSPVLWLVGVSIIAFVTVHLATTPSLEGWPRIVAFLCWWELMRLVLRKL